MNAIEFNVTYYRQQAEKNRRSARNIRILSTVFYVLAAIFAVIGGLVAVAGVWTSALIIFSSVIIITVNSFQLRDIARSRLNIARRWDRLAQGYSNV